MPKITLDDLDDRIKKGIREVLPEELKKSLSSHVLPDGYTRCKNCGEIYKETLDKCPYCQNGEAKPQEDDDLLSID